MNRRDWLKNAAVLGVAASHYLGAGTPASCAEDSSGDAVSIGTRRELFVDGYLIDRLAGEARQQLHQPVPREIALKHDAPWEGTGSGYHSIFRDGAVYRMYYKAWHLDVSKGKLNTGRHPLFCCLAESEDGIHWSKPELGLHEFEGSTKNNIVMVSGKLGPLNVDAGHPAIFLDDNPEAPKEGRYKAIFRSSKPNGLLPFQSPDGLHWSPITDKPILSGLGAFDSQNLAFWDPNISQYRAYWRIFSQGRRAIRTATSDNLVDWGKHTDLSYEDSPPEQLYTNQIKPYYRAPHLLIGFPTRYIDRGWSESMQSLPEKDHRELRSSSTNRYGTAITEALMMSSRNGTHFHRWNEAFLPPGIERPGSWNYGHQYVGWHLVETQSALPGAPNELSLYAGESYWTGQGSAVRRYTLRLDGFVSIHASRKGGELITKPLTFSGKKLALNFATSAAGSIRVELQQPDGQPIPGYRLSDCPPIFGNTIERVITWKDGADLSQLAGQPIKLRFELQDADLYAMQFVA